MWSSHRAKRASTECSALQAAVLELRQQDPGVGPDQIPDRATVAEGCMKSCRRNLETLFDHLVGDGEKRRWHGESERFCGLEIDN
jgi:hypothetical protein